MDSPRRRKKRISERERVRFAIIGAGRVGPVLGRLLREGGHTPTAVISRTLRSARIGARFVGCRVASTDLRELPRETGLIIIAAPHAAVGEIASELATSREDLRGVALCHASGMHTAEILEPARKKGAIVFSFHPLQTFPRDMSHRDLLPTARGIPFGIDGPAAGVRWGRRLARMLGGSALLIPPEMRELYHAACVVASNHVATMTWIVERMFARMGTRRGEALRAVEPIVRATLGNTFGSSPAAALSGPIARGGTETLEKHLNAIRRHSPELLPYFIAVSLETVALAEVKGSAGPEAVSKMRGLLRAMADQH